MELLEGGKETLFEGGALRGERLKDLAVEIEHFERQKPISLNSTISDMQEL